MPILNKVETDDVMLQAVETAKMMLQSSDVDTAVVSSMLQDPPVRKAWVRTAGIVLAADKATRYGAAKQALPWNGETLASHAARTALEAGLDPVIVVLGYEAETIEQSLADLPVQPVFNSDFESGQSTSLRKGLESLPLHTGAVVFLLADQPLIAADTIRKITEAHKHSFAPACVPVFHGKRGNPVLFDKALFRELSELRGDVGGSELLDKYASAVVRERAGLAVMLDIDTPEEYEKQKTENRRQETELGVQNRDARFDK